MALTFVDENDSERRRLHALTLSLEAADFKRVLESGLTVSGTLVHLAFWDDFADALLLEWQHAGFSPILGDVDATNSAIAAVAGAVTGPAAAALAREAAGRVDATVASLPPELVVVIEREGHPFMVNRATHRRLHLDQIERAITL